MYRRVEQSFYALSAFVLIAIMFVAQPSHARIETEDFSADIISHVSIAWQELIVGFNPVKEVAFVWESVDVFYQESTTHTIAMLEPTEISPEIKQAIDNIAFATADLFDFESPMVAVENLSFANVDPEPIYNIVPSLNVKPQETQTAVLGLEVSKVGNDELMEQGKEWFERINNYVEQSNQTLAQDFSEVSVPTIAGEHDPPEEEILIDRGNEEHFAFDRVELSSPVNNAQRPWVTIQDNYTGQMYCLAIYNNEVNKYLGECKYDYE